MKKISIVIPVYCEEEIIQKSYERLTKNMKELMDKYDYEMIFINDGSTDKTMQILENITDGDSRVKVISFSRNFGQQVAITAGLNYVSGDAVIIIDSDLQDPPEIIPDMLKEWENGYDVIYGKRKARKGESAFKLLTAKAFYSLLNKMSDIEIPKDTGDFRLVDRRVVDVINALPEHNKFLRGLFSWVGFKQLPFEYERQERSAGKTKYPLSKMFKLAFDGIVSFSTRPLKVIGLLGLASVSVSVVMLVYALLSFVFKWYNLVSGWTSLMCVITFFGGMTLISLWMIGEYIARIYDETKQRPQYIIEKKLNI